ncbi:divalent cation tolerance protein CutA [Sphingomonas sp. SFZ2018-12]|uniref:divalent-cation tolerance protein CutA n=1 Tax=Sphingomonas sp. SFZ2018-12 TaxID=2683197 RepID=UPI001F106581|nr:divalent cation tolerance protein CutA [Sphingomonas sp. SFZ2018-12]MCH4894624.1 divalent cation tolerance protein CutA [Sphingomonas sp. SFZ2018-12]
MTLAVLYTTFPDAATAERIGATLIAERLAACVNLLAPCRSLFAWEGRIEQAQEVPALFKTAYDRADALAARLAALHPYDLPVIEQWAASAGFEAQAWVDAATRG